MLELAGSATGVTEKREGRLPRLGVPSDGGARFVDEVTGTEVCTVEVGAAVVFASGLSNWAADETCATELTGGNEDGGGIEIAAAAAVA